MKGLRLAATMLVFVLSACGNRGPLYLPPPPQSAPATQTAADDASAVSQEQQ